MPLANGTRLGPYEILAELGTGGMGEVYRARDTRLGRDVAIKVLLGINSSTEESRQRFQREARTISKLSHPHICALYDVGRERAIDYLVMELLEGGTLADRLAKGAMPFEQVLQSGVEIASALSAAHAVGIVHRDLEPGNIMVTDSGIKLLDFGLAKVLASAASVEDLASASTLPMSLTQEGSVLGTLPYMAPEQVQGKDADPRADIFALGAILFEMATGKRAFAGTNRAMLTSVILTIEPPLVSSIQAASPPAFDQLVRTCLAKDPAARWSSAHDLGLRLRLIAGESRTLDSRTGAAAIRRRTQWLPWVITLLAILVAAGYLVRPRFLPRSMPEILSPGIRPSVVIPREIQVFAAFGISPDGRRLLFMGRPRANEGDTAPRPRLYRRRLDGFQVEPIDGTEGVTMFRNTRDGQWIAFTTPISERTTQLRFAKVPAEGSAPPVVVAVMDPSWTSWVMLQSGDVLVNDIDGTHYVRIPGNGGEPSEPISLRPPGYEGTLHLRRALPGDSGVLLDVLIYGGGAWQAGVGVLDLKSNQAKILVRDGSCPRYVRTGYLVFSRGDALFAVQFDLDRLEIRGDPVAITKGLRVPVGSGGNAGFDLSENGVLVFAPGEVMGSRRRQVIVDTQGRVSEWSSERQGFELIPSVSPDGSHVATAINNPRMLLEVWLSERGRPAARRLVADPAADCGFPIWSPDGRQIAYTRTSSDGNSGIYIKSLDGEAKPRRIYDIKSRNSNEAATSWSPDGSTILIWTLEAGNADIFRVPANLQSKNPPVASPVLASPAGESGGKFSPDGRWIAFTSDETGRQEVYVAAYGSSGIVGTPVMISTEGGTQIRWSRDGMRVYYASLQGRVMSVELETKLALAAAMPLPRWNLAQLRVDNLQWDILPDGSLFAVQKDEREDEVTRFDVVLNFTEELRQRVKAAANPPP